MLPARGQHQGSAEGSSVSCSWVTKHVFCTHETIFVRDETHLKLSAATVRPLRPVVAGWASALAVQNMEGGMTPVQVQLVQDSFKTIAPAAATAADLFYDRLFMTAPQLRPLFPRDLSEQKKKLV